MWFVPLCPHYWQSLKCSGAAGSVGSRRGRGEQAFEHRPANFKRDYKPGHRGKQREKEPEAAPALAGRASGALALAAGTFWGQSRGYGKQRVRIFSGVDGRGGSEKKEKIHRPHPAVCVSVQLVQLGRPPLQAGGRGRGQEGGGDAGEFCSDHFSPSRTWKGRFPEV